MFYSIFLVYKEKYSIINEVFSSGVQILSVIFKKKNETWLLLSSDKLRCWIVSNVKILLIDLIAC